MEDAFSALDAAEQREIEQRLRGPDGDRTMIKIAQRLGTVTDADEIIVLDARRDRASAASTTSCWSRAGCTSSSSRTSWARRRSAAPARPCGGSASWSRSPACRRRCWRRRRACCSTPSAPRARSSAARAASATSCSSSGAATSRSSSTTRRGTSGSSTSLHEGDYVGEISFMSSDPAHGDGPRPDQRRGSHPAAAGLRRVAGAARHGHAHSPGRHGPGPHRGHPPEAGGGLGRELERLTDHGNDGKRKYGTPAGGFPLDRSGHRNRVTTIGIAPDEAACRL